MGFFRRLFGAKKKPTTTQTPASKRRWSFAKHSTQPPSSSVLNHHYDPSSSSLDANKHAIAVAAATAAVAEAALAAAHAAAEVVRLTSAGAPPTTPTTTSRPTVLSTAAVMIQSAFRGYLARRALRALKALVKLQALVRGHIVRKQTADMLRRMQTLVRLQAQARATRVFSHSHMHSFKPSLSHYYPVPQEYSTKFDGSSILKRCSSNANFRNSERERARFGSTWLERWMEERENRDDEEKMSDKILEVDTWKPPLRSLKGKGEACSRTADNSPQALLSWSSSRKGPFTPTRSECSFHGYAGGHPNYMSNTHSSRAKVRSQSAPRQRLDCDRYGTQGVWDVMASNNNHLYHSHFRSKVYPPPPSSSRFNRIR